ncbi:hypothetical protein ACWEWU_11680 [Staphylococcus xylosus]
MEIRLFDLVNNKVDVRDYMFIHNGKIMVNADHVYKVILDTDKVTLHQQMEMFDSKDEMFKKAKAFSKLVELYSQKDEIPSDEFFDEMGYIIKERDWMANKFDKLLEQFSREEIKRDVLQEVYRKAKAFDEVKEYVLSKDKDFEDRKDRARSNSEFNYFETLQIANRAIINKCKQVEDE